MLALLFFYFAIIQFKFGFVKIVALVFRWCVYGKR